MIVVRGCYICAVIWVHVYDPNGGREQGGRAARRRRQPLFRSRSRSLGRSEAASSVLPEIYNAYKVRESEWSELRLTLVLKTLLLWERALRGETSWKIPYNIVLRVAEHSLGWNSLCFHVNSPQPDIKHNREITLLICETKWTAQICEGRGSCFVSSLTYSEKSARVSLLSPASHLVSDSHKSIYFCHLIYHGDRPSVTLKLLKVRLH